MEGEKGAYYHLENPLFPENYVAEILRAEQNYKYVIIPTFMSVVEILTRDFARKVVLCYPDRSLREEYRERYIKRGNSGSFLELFADGWHGLLAPVEELARTVEGRKHNLVLPFWGEKEMYLYAISDMDAPQERQSLYEVGKHLFELCGIK